VEEVNEVLVEKLGEEDAELLFQFEKNNRLFFEKMVPGRGEDYYSFKVFQEKHQGLLQEQSQGQSYFYLMKNPAGEIMGRINLSDVENTSKGKSAHIGYRVGEAFIGKGVANKAVAFILKEAITHQITTIHAKTTTNNPASQKVLKRNGFKYMKTERKSFGMNGERVHFIHYIYSIGRYYC
jgi:ribosomal-protein-alanine N-acetyltransferase